MEQTFSALMDHLAQPPDDLAYVTMYIGAPDEKGGMDYLAGYLSSKDQPVLQGLTTGLIAAGTYLSAVHTGPYAQLPQVHAALGRALESGRYTLTGNVWEHYLVHPQVEPDSTQLKTRVYYPVRVIELPQ